jgi:hypothetical protein
MIIPVIPKCITGSLPVPESSSQNLPSASKLKVKVKVDFSLHYFTLQERSRKVEGTQWEGLNLGLGLGLNLHLAFPGTSCYCPSFQFFDLLCREHEYRRDIQQTMTISASGSDRTDDNYTSIALSHNPRVRSHRYRRSCLP